MGTEEWIEHIEKETEEALRFFYAQQAYRICLFQDNGTEIVHKNYHFWKLLSVSVQKSLFISIRRIFDDVSGAKSLSKFQGHCLTNYDDFSLKSLESRMLLRRSGLSGDYINRYLDESDCAGKKEIAKLFKPLSTINDPAKRIYRKITSQAFSHAILTKENEYGDLFERASNFEIEKILLTVWAVTKNVWQLYHNGRLYSRDYLVYEYEYRDEVFDAVYKAFNNY